MPLASALTTTVTVALPKLAIAPSEQLTAVSQLPWLGVAEIRVTLPGSAALRVAAVAPSGPLLVTVTE